MGRSRSFITPRKAVGADRNGTSSTYRVGEASAYVQSSGLKAVAAVFARFMNSPVTREESRVTDQPSWGSSGMADDTLWMNFSHILQYAMVGVNIVPLIISLAYVLVVSVRTRFENRRQQQEAAKK